MQERRTTVLAGAAAAVLLLAVLAALATWGYVRNSAGSSGNPLAIGVVFAAVLAAGAVGLLILSDRQEPSVRADGRPAGGAGGSATGLASEPGDAGLDPVDPLDDATQEQPVLRPRTALDPLGRRYGRHARPDGETGEDDSPTADRPMASELFHPLPDDLATTLHDQLFTHRGAPSGRD
ncbi:hypothetical protein FDO65_07170 [Nakamurella flava]|uniref:Uncharacterized protein n=1 Tax=Nakamurella flava TaxID=2576308 RepID=A0A4U6QLC5_9ACTN|nr:hypothetical protein [Nakamurella flava]TKV61367.1 hypothetical protein FDO65_07170 [Nakamurella flava]